MYEPLKNDGDFSQIATPIFESMKLGYVVLMKWTCPGCGERVTADEPLKLMVYEGRQVVAFPPGYIHTEKDDHTPCGESVDTQKYRFGFTLIMGSGDMSWLFRS